jgi:hypothetical protein
MTSADWFEAECSKAATAAWNAYMRDPVTRLYLWYRQGALAAAADQPAGFELGDPLPISSAHTREQMRSRIVDVARRLPCLPVSEAQS